VFRSPFGPGWRFVVDGEFGHATYTSEPAAMQASFDDVFRAVQAKTKARPTVKVQPGPIACPPCLAALGLSADATLDQVKAMFRRLAWSMHPDVGGNAGDFVKLRRDYEQAVHWTSTYGRARGFVPQPG
jgi:hypothetical protein